MITKEKEKKVKRSESQQRRNKKELETKAVIFLVTNPKATTKDFCKSEGVSYQYFRYKCDLKKIHEMVDDAISKKQAKRLKVLEKELEKQGEHEAFDISHLYDISLVILKETIEYLKHNVPNFKNTSDVIRCFIETGRFQLELFNKGFVKMPQKENPYQEVIDHVKQLFEFKVKTNENNLNTNENSNNPIVDDANTETIATKEIYN